MVLMMLKEEKREEIGNKILGFIEDIHGEGACEIRFIPEHKKMGKSISLLKNGNYIYANNSKGKKVKVCDADPQSFGHYLNESLMHAGYTSVCFTVNSPSFEIMESCTTTNEHVLAGKINCQFVDIDAPKELRHDKKILLSWKQETKKQILSFLLKPSIVVETKNGYHVYWLLDNGQHKLFRHIQMQLVQHFIGDKKCINEARVLRLPYFKHLKNINDPFIVRPKLKNLKSRYTQEEIKNALPELEEETLKKVMKKYDKNKPIEVVHVKKGSILELITTKINRNIIKQSESKITMHCCMPDHEDRNPSAWIDTDYMWFHCSGCGTHLHLTELAEILGWKEVLDEWNKYNIDIGSELDKIRGEMVKVNELDHLKLTDDEKSRVERISLKVFEKLISFGQNPSSNHKQNIRDIIQILLKSNKEEKPYLLPLIMGGGKSLIIETFLQESIKEDIEFGAVVTVERIEDVKALAERLNTFIDKEIAYPLYGFDKKECLLNISKGLEHGTCPARKGMSCPFKRECRYLNQGTEQEKFPVVIMTTLRLSLQHKDIDKFKYFIKSENDNVRKVNRELLIIDEKPRLTSVTTVAVKDFNIFTDIILKYLETFDFNGSIEEYKIFQSTVEIVASLYNKSMCGRQIIEPVNVDFSFSDEFWKIFNHKFDYTNSLYSIPRIIESIINYGGHIDKKNEEDVSITTSSTIPYTKFKNYKTVIFDGTANIDTEYKHDKYYLIDFETIKSFNNLTFYVSSLVNGSKSSMKKDSRIEPFCKDIIKIADENKTERIFVPVFKDIKEAVEGFLEDYIDSGQIEVASYGSTKGSNAFKDCSIVVLGGILHKTEDFYIGKTIANMGNNREDILDITCNKYGKTRRFNESKIEKVKLLDMIVDYTQEIMRSSQRNISKNVNGKVYVFHHDEILLGLLQSMFTESIFEKWIPQNIIETNINMKTNNKNVKAIYEYLTKHTEKEIYFSEILKEVGLTKQLFSNTLKNPSMQAFLEVNNYVEKRNGRKKLFMKIDK